jgi:hypothetical protein
MLGIPDTPPASKWHFSLTYWRQRQLGTLRRYPRKDALILCLCKV